MTRNFTDLTGKKAIVTGGAQGLCHGMAEGLMEAGAQVCIIDVNPAVTQVAEAFAERGFGCCGVVADLGNKDRLEEGFSRAVERLGGRLDIIVNGAGVQRRHKSEEFPCEDWEFVLNINLNAVFRLCQLAGRQFMAQQSKGKIINIASMLSFFGGYTVPATDPENPRFKEITDRIPAGVWGTAEDMKGPCVFLASEASDYLNGAIIPVDGGYLVK